MKKVLWLIVFAFLYGGIKIYSNTIKVPDNYSTIQGAINAAVNGDTVLVNSGIYKENINFRGKNIVVTSYFGISGDVSFINNTTIDGSNPVYPDTASCVLIISGEDSTAVLQGFTLTGGKGTKWPDEHGAGTFVEGGGIFMTLSSPTIKYNLIVNNEAINSPAGTISAGGGAIRCGDGSPRIINNIILNNEGMYGGGIVLNYCSGALIANNIINGNRVYQAVSNRQTFGGGGLWIYATLPGSGMQNKVINNTIVSNSCNDIGGGIRIWSTKVTVLNNIVWNNSQNDPDQINVSSSTSTIEYNDVENGVVGIGNINLQPSFFENSFYLNGESPCIDAGNPDIQYNDIEDINLPGNALFPSLGTIRNDMGAYGGSFPLLFPEFSSPHINFLNDEFNFGLTLPGEPVEMTITLLNNGSSALKIDSVVAVQKNNEIAAQNSFPLIITPPDTAKIVLIWTPQMNEILADTLLIYHNDRYTEYPSKLFISGNSYPNALLAFNVATYDYGDIDVNTSRVDTVLYIYNDGTANDSVYTSIIYGVVNPDSSLELTPKAFIVEPEDSVGILFTIYPSRIIRTAFNIYQPKIVIDSRFSVGTMHFEKTMKFHLVGTTDVNEETGLPGKFSLSQNYPNPFNSTTNIEFKIPKSGYVTFKIYNILGKEVASLVNENKPAGGYSISFDASDLPSGIYFYTLISGTFKESKKMILLK